MNISPELYASTNAGQLRGGKQLIEMIVSEYNEKKIDIVLDIGCGTGIITALMASRINAGHIYGVDIDEAMIAFANQLNTNDNISYIVQDFRIEFDHMAPELTALEGKVSLVLANFSLHWILDKQMVAQNLNRLLTKGGKVFTNILSIPNPFNHMSDERKAFYKKMFMRIPEPQEQHMEWLTAFDSHGLTITTNEFMKIQSVFKFNDFMKYIEINVNSLLIYFMGTDEERQRLSSKLPAIIVSNNHVYSDENTGEEMIEWALNIFQFVIEK